MALTKTVTTVWPTRATRNFFNIGVKVVLKDGATVVFDETFMVHAQKTDNPEEKAPEALEKAQKAVNVFLAARTINDHAKYETFRAAVDDGLDIGE